MALYVNLADTREAIEFIIDSCGYPSNQLLQSIANLQFEYLLEDMFEEIALTLALNSDITALTTTRLLSRSVLTTSPGSIVSMHTLLLPMIK